MKDDEKAVRLLGLYQQVLQGAELSGDNLPERMALLLTGLVIAEQEHLFSYNEIYRRVFSDEWVAQELAKLRPYAESLRQWLANGRDHKYLLTGQGFLDAQQWSLTRRLTEEDSQYLAASQKLHTEDVQAKAEEIIRETKSEAAQIKKRANNYGVAAGLGVIGSIGISVVMLFYSSEVAWQTRIEQASNEALVNFPESSLERTIAAMKVGRELKHKVKSDPITKYPTYAPLNILRQAISTDWHETNRLAGHQDLVFGVAVSADGQTIVSGSDDKTVKVWKKDGSLLTTLIGHQDHVRTVGVSADGQTIVSADNNGTVNVWRRNGSLITTIKGVHQDSNSQVTVSADGQTIVAFDGEQTVKVWDRDGSLIATRKGFSVAVSADGKTIVSGSDSINIRVSADGKKIISGSDNNTAKMWERDGSLLTTLKGDKDWGTIVEISEDGQTIISKTPKTLRVWRPDGSLISTIKGIEAGNRPESD